MNEDLQEVLKALKVMYELLSDTPLFFYDVSQDAFDAALDEAERVMAKYGVEPEAQEHGLKKCLGLD